MYKKYLFLLPFFITDILAMGYIAYQISDDLRAKIDVFYKVHNLPLDPKITFFHTDDKRFQQPTEISTPINKPLFCRSSEHPYLIILSAYHYELLKQIKIEKMNDTLSVTADYDLSIDLYYFWARYNNYGSFSADEQDYLESRTWDDVMQVMPDSWLDYYYNRLGNSEGKYYQKLKTEWQKRQDIKAIKAARQKQEDTKQVS